MLLQAGAAGIGGIAMASARRLVALAASVSPRLRPPDPHTARRQVFSRSFSSSFVRPDGTQEASEVESEVAPGEPVEGDGSMVNGEGCLADTELRRP